MDARELVGLSMFVGGEIIAAIGTTSLIRAREERGRLLPGWAIVAVGAVIALWGACL